MPTCARCARPFSPHARTSWRVLLSDQKVIQLHRRCAHARDYRELFLSEVTPTLRPSLIVEQEDLLAALAKVADHPLVASRITQAQRRLAHLHALPFSVFA
jgi:hypothetical protein